MDKDTDKTDTRPQKGEGSPDTDSVVKTRQDTRGRRKSQSRRNSKKSGCKDEPGVEKIRQCGDEDWIEQSVVLKRVKPRRQNRKWRQKAKKSENDDDCSSDDDVNRRRERGHSSKKPIRKQKVQSPTRQISYSEGQELALRVPDKNEEEDALLFRGVFRHEMVHLHEQLKWFKNQCQSELEAYEQTTQKRRDKIKGEVSQLTHERNLLKAPLQLEQLKEEEELMNKRKKLLTFAEELLDREESLLQRQDNLKDFEREVDELERSIDRRQEIVTRKRDDITEQSQRMGEDAKSEDTTSVQDTSNSSTVKLRSHWTVVQEWVTREQQSTKEALRHCKAKLAITENEAQEKDRVIHKLQEQIKESQTAAEGNSRKLKDLEGRFALLIQENLTRDHTSSNSCEMSSESLGLQPSVDLSASVKSGSSVLLASLSETPGKNQPGLGFRPGGLAMQLPASYHRQLRRQVSSNSTNSNYSTLYDECGGTNSTKISSLRRKAANPENLKNPRRVCSKGDFNRDSGNLENTDRKLEYDVGQHACISRSCTIL